MDPTKIISIIIASMISLTPMSAIKDNGTPIMNIVEQQIKEEEKEEQAKKEKAESEKKQSAKSSSKKTSESKEESKSELDKILSACNVDCDKSELKFISTKKQYTDEEIKRLAQVLYCEAGGTSWECQVVVFSTILNHCDYEGGLDVLDSVNHFSVAPYYRNKTPNSTQYKVIDYVLSGHRIAGIKYFRDDYYHNFGKKMLNIDGMYFSK